MSERKTKPKFSSGDVLGAFVLGIICAIPMIVLVYFVLKEQAEDSARLIVFVAIGACIGAVLSLIAVRVVLSKILSRSDPSLQTVFSEASDSLGALGNGDTKSASKHARQATMDALGLIGWLTARRWITSVFLASVGMFAGAASVYVLLQQNAILGQQSKLLEVQEQIFLDQSGLMRDTMLAQDSLRYVPLYSELTRLIGEISAAGASRESLEEYELVDLNDELSNRIATLTRSFRPYWYFDSYSDYQRRSGPGSSGRVPMVFLSPERGLILRALVENRVAIADSHSADFSYSDMRGLSLFGYHQHGLFSDSGANRYFLALGSCSNAGNYAMQSTNFGTSFDGEELPGFSDDEELSGRLFSNDFSMYNLSYADFSHTSISGAYFEDLHGTLVFEHTELANTSIYTRFGVTLDRADIRSIRIDRLSGLENPRLSLKGARIIGQICFGEAEESKLEESSPEEIENWNFIANTVYGLDGDSMAAALVQDAWVESGYFSFVSFEPSASGGRPTDSPRWDFQYLAVQ